MKKISKYMMIALTGALAVGCTDLNTEPMGDVVTEDQKEEVLKNDPEKVEAGINSLPYGLKQVMTISSSSHEDFGVASMFLITDSRGMDMPAPNIGYNWYTAASELSDWGARYYNNILYWGTYYNLIRTCNQVESSMTIEEGDSDSMYYLGQICTYRAYAYLNLAYMYAFTYAKDPNAPCVPVITAENMVEAAANGLPRATVEEVYIQVKKDLDRAIEAFESTDVKRPDKRFVDATVAYGLRARMNLVTCKWEDAAADAQQAITLAGKSGLGILSAAAASVPGFNNLDAPNIIWGIKNESTESFTQGVVNFASMMGSWMPNGYCGSGVYRSINKKLYNQIPTTDVRRGWWLNGTKVPSSLPEEYAAYATAKEFPAYTQVKFGAAEDTPGLASGATDIPLMRVEEMHLIYAEAITRSQGASAGATYLSSFVTACRDPQFTLRGTSVEDVIDAIWFQRRIELWGEGFSYSDMMRLQKPMNRLGGGFDAAWVFNIDPSDPCLILQIVQSEQEANPMINPSDCQTGATIPSPIPDEE